MNAQGRLSKAEKGSVALGICQELAEKLEKMSGLGFSRGGLLANLGYSEAEREELQKTLELLGFSVGRRV